MWPFRKKTRSRRAEPKKPAAATEPGRWQRFRRAGGLAAVLIAAAFYAAVTALDVVPLEPLPYRVGQYVPGDIYARVSFRVHSPAATAQKRKDAAESTPAVIRLDEQALERIVGAIRNLPGKLRAASRPTDLDAELRDAFNIRRPEDLAGFARLAGPEQVEAWHRQVAELRERLTERYVVTKEAFSQAYGKLLTRQVRVLSGEARGLFPKDGLLSLDSRELGTFLASAAAKLPAPIRDNVVHYLERTVSGDAALYRLDAEATAAAELAARNAVRPQTEAITAGTLLVARSDRPGGDRPEGERPGADPRLERSEWERLAAEHEAFLRHQARLRPWRRAWLLAGRAAMIAAVVVLMALYIRKYRPRVVANPLRGFSIAALLTLMLLYTRLVVGAGLLNPYLAVFGVFVAAVVLTIVYDQRFAFAVTGALVVLAALQTRLGLGGMLVLWAAAAAAVFQLREVRTRSKLIETGGITAVVVFAAVWAVEASRSVPARYIIEPGCWAAGAALAGGFLIQGILPLIERVFGIATSLTLLEWCDADKPLLKRLALEANGTYNHSLLLGSMCEPAAEAVGARGLLARVGAYYHDIGKINKPAYFNENQAGPGSPHDRLSPAMSLLVIKGHVKDGLDLARRYGLPRELHEFITSHHGTTLVEYFYNAAVEQRKLDAEPAPDEVEFRYPGPKPRSKEAAVLMMADAAECAVRAMAEPTPGRIETQVHQIVSKRLTDGQFDECDLTLREIHVIESSLVKSLAGMYHARVQYPSQKGRGAPATQPEPAAVGASNRPNGPRGQRRNA